MIQVKRAYEEPSSKDGARFLVDRLWPRGLMKDALEIKGWLKEAAPSNDLRKRFHHDASKWDQFRKHYFADLEKDPASWEPILQAARRGTVTLIYGARDTEHNNAVALKEFLERRLHRKK